MSLLESIRNVFHERQAERFATFGELVAQVANEDFADPANIAAELEALGKTPADLEQAIHDLKQLNALRVQVAAGEEADAELDRIVAQIAEADAVLAQAAKAREEIVAPLMARRQTVDAIRAGARGAAATLRKLEHPTQQAERSAVAWVKQ